MFCWQVSEAADEHCGGKSTTRWNFTSAGACTARARACFGCQSLQASDAGDWERWRNQPENLTARDKSWKSTCRQVIAPGKGVLYSLLNLIICTYLVVLPRKNDTACDPSLSRSSASVSSYHICSTPFRPLSTFEIVHGPHHYRRTRCLSRVWSGTTGTLAHSVEHLFYCSAHPTQLTVQDLWDNPAEVADFLNLDSWRQWTRREELLGGHNNKNVSLLCTVAWENGNAFSMWVARWCSG